MSNLQEGYELLWAKLLANNQFYSFAFQKMQIPGCLGFVSDELKWVIVCHTASDGKGSSRKNKLKAKPSYKRLYVSEKELVHDFGSVLQYLENELRSQLGKPCGE